jgi:amino acid adenylation domain-containing protein/non-ribosomal peptide synthase protein (TIGR01720 family)
MLYHWLQNPQSGADVEQMVCTLAEKIDAARLRAAWERAVARHAALRIRFEWSVAEPVQSIAPHLNLRWQELDYREKDAEAFQNFLHADRFAGFDLSIAPLMRCTLICVTEHEWRLVWTFHHLVLDGRSITRILHEVFSDYDGTPSQERAAGSLPDYLTWQAGLEHSGSETFWKSHLAGAHGPSPTVIENLGQLSAASAQAEEDHSLTKEVTYNLESLADGAVVTLSTLVQAAWALYISRSTGEENVIFGATRACRHVDCPGAKDLPGLLINTVPFHTAVPGDQPLIPWLQSLRRAWMDMRAHELTPLPLIRRMAGLPGDRPLFNHLVVFEHNDFTGLLHKLHPEWKQRRFDLRELTTVPLTLQVYGGESLRLHCAFDTSRFDAVFIRRMLGHVAHLLEQFAASPEATLDHYTLATEEESRALIAHGSCGTLELDSNITLHQWFTEIAARFPDRIAVSGSHGAWTYRELDQRSNGVAGALAAEGVKRGDLVGLLMDRTGGLTAAILGILKAGAAYLPIDPAYPAERASFMLADAGVRVLLTDAAMSGKIPAGSFRTVLCDNISAASGTPDAAGHSPEDTAYIIYTSGSTGQPKGCMISHRNVVRLMKATEPWFAFDERDVWTLFHSAAFDFSVWEIWGALLYGGRLCVVPWLTTRSPEDFCRLLCQEGVTILNQTPSAFRQLIAAEPLARGIDPALPPFALRKVIFGGEALEMHSLRPWFERHGDTQPELVNMYGITETTVHVTYRPLSAVDLDRGSVIGEPIPDLQLFVLDPRTLQPAPVGITGEMYVAGAGLGKGYLNRTELTAARFPDNHLTGTGHLYRTGDLARFIPSGDGLDLEFLGRIDDQVKIRGFRIELGEIESVLCTHPDIREAAVFVREERPGDKRLCAWFVSARPPSATELREHLKSRLPEYMVPAAFVPMTAFPLTTNGKLDRRALPAPITETEARTYTAPATPAEQTLTAIWQKVLRIERVGVNDNFFELGGDSILSIQAIARARQAGLRLTPRQLFENPTAAALAAIVTDSIDTPVVAEVAGPFPPSPIQQWFLDQELQGGHHWNQTFLFTVSERLDPAALASALRAVMTHHSALRLRFACRHNQWEQSVHPEPDNDILSLHDLTEYSNGRLTKQIERTCRVEQARLNFEFGPLMRAAYIDCGEDRPGRLLITVHHLAVDGVSWRVLLEDIEKAYRDIVSGKSAALPPATAPFSAWAKQVLAWPQSAAAKSEPAWWQEVITRSESAATLLAESDGVMANTEANSYVIRTRLTREETTALVQKVPAVMRSRINDVLLTALCRAVNAVTGNRRIAFHMEGHGRESHIGGDLDVSRTVGWFTTVFPVCLDLPETSDLAEQVRDVQQQLFAMPGNGSGFSALGLRHEAAVLFNYLGRMDSVTEGSELFSFAQESTGPWHSQTAERKYQIEINAMITGGEFEVAWTAGRFLHSRETIQLLADGFHTVLQDIVRHCGTADGAPDTSLSGLDTAAIAGLVKDRSGIVEISVLSPMQQLFYSASLTKPGAGYDQWHCRIKGPLHAELFQAAWAAVIARHSILRSSFHSAGLPHPVQVVCEKIVPEWRVIDAADVDPDKTISVLLAEDAAARNDLTLPMLSRFTLARFGAEDHFFLWSVPDLHLDGWSWPVVFAEVNECLCALREGRAPNLAPALPYRVWLEWLQHQSPARSLGYWRESLAGLTEPTHLPVDLAPGPGSARRFSSVSLTFDGSGVVAGARRLSLSPGTLVQAAWALLLARGTGAGDIVFGTAFSGRPADLEGAARIVGPFVNNLPVRLRIDPNDSVQALLHSLQKRLFDISEHQFASITTVQDCSAIPWRSRVFNSLAVFQNYEVGAEAKRFGQAALTDFKGPLHTSYPLTLVVTPGDEWKAELLFQESWCSRDRAELLLADVASLLSALSANPGTSCADLITQCRLPAGASLRINAAAPRRPTGSPPRTIIEKSLAALWQRAFGLTDISTSDNFFDLGGGSLLMVRLHAAIRAELGREVPLVDLFRFPTIAALARHLDPASAPPVPAVQMMDLTQSRAAAARAAAAKARDARIR